MAAPSCPAPVSMASFIHENVQPQMMVTTNKANRAIRADWVDMAGVLGHPNTQLPHKRQHPCDDGPEILVSETPSFKARVTILTLSSAITAGLCEGLVRLADGNATPMIRLFEQTDSGDIRLRPSDEARVSAPVGEPWEIRTNPSGHRDAGTDLNDRAWIVVGDSQVMGNGVADHEPFPALLSVDGQSAHNLGVPGYGVGDALWAATRHLDQQPAEGVVVIINQMNDWEEVDAPVGERYAVRGGWLLKSKDAAGPRGHFLASPLSRSHLFFLIGHLLLRDWDTVEPPPPRWMTSPAEERENTIRIAAALTAFAKAHPETRIVPAYLPADVYATAERADDTPLPASGWKDGPPPWEDRRLADQIMTALSDMDPIDLSPALGGDEYFLKGDYHLSPEGHRAVARLIQARIDSAPGSAEDAGPEPERAPQ